MKGLELSRALFDECLRPLLEREAPQLLPLVAAGLVGEGSECFGFDDERSQDHDWGASLCLWLPDDSPENAFGTLDSLLTGLPERFRGVPLRVHAPGRTGVFRVGAFYRSLIGRADAPESAEDWIAVPEPSLAAATNGAVFYDGAGAFSGVRERLLAYYPEDARRFRLAQCAALAGQTGQYNYARCLMRGETAAAQIIRGRFLENTAALIFLLNRRYRPFYKWSWRALRMLPLLGAETDELADRLSVLPDGPDAAALMEKIASGIIGELRRQGLSDSGSDFLMDHIGALLGGVQDEKLRMRGISLVF